MAINKETTSTSEVDLDLESWLGAPGSESIITPTSEDQDSKQKNNFFSPIKQDLGFMDHLDEDSDKITIAEEEKDEEGNVTAEKVTEKLSDIISELDGSDPNDIDGDKEEESDEKKSKGGRPKTEKSGLVEFLKKRIESKEMVPFDDFDEESGNLDEYLGNMTEADIEELWTANMESFKQDVAANTPKEFFQSLPEELQYAAKYVLDGGQDIKGLFRALAHVEETRSLDPEAEDDQEAIVRGYLSATKFGDDAEIDEEITTWKDLGVLEKKAKQFKPKLDSMQEQVVAAQLEEQEQRKLQQQAAADAYVNNTFEALRTGEINGIKLDKKVQSQLYAGLVKPQYASISGRPTNLLGHLLEKYQFVEPNYPLIAEALWLLSDPDDYREKVSGKAKTAAVETIARKLKTEESRKTSGGTGTPAPEDQKTPSRKLPRVNHIFKR